MRSRSRMWFICFGRIVGLVLVAELTGGIMVGFSERPIAAQSRPSLCTVTVDKTAGPPIVLLGDQVQVRLALQSECPSGPSPIDVILVIDQSDSMSNDNKLVNAKAAALAFLEAVDLSQSRVGIVAFNHVAGLRSELTQDRTALQRAITGLRAGGQTNVSAAITAAHAELNRDPLGASRAMIVLTDGYNTAPGAEPIPVAAARVHADGITAAAICAGGQCDPDLPSAASDPSLYYDVPDTSQLSDLYRALAGSLQTNGITTLFIRDDLPSNMRYVSGSAVPAPTNEGAGFLEWAFAGPSPAEITYFVEPLQVGLHPTNIVARADFQDKLGGSGSVPFPVPKVRVLASPGCISEPLEVMFLIDDSNCLYSQSLNEMDARSAIKVGIERVLDRMDMTVDTAAVIGFGDRAITFQTLTHDRQAVLDAVDRIAMRDAWARLDLGYQAVAREMGTTRHDPNSNVVTITVTDGPMMQAPENAQDAGELLQRMGVRHYAIGVGFVAQHALLRQLCEIHGYHEIPFGGDVIGKYEIIGTSVVTLGADCNPPGGPTATPWTPPGPTTRIHLPIALDHDSSLAPYPGPRAR